MQARPMLRRNVPANVPLVPGQPDRILRLPHAGLTTQFGQAMRHVIGGGVVQFNGPHGDGDGQGRLYLVPLDFPLDGHVLASLPRVSGREFCGPRYAVLAELQAHPFVIVRRGIERAILAKRFHLARTPGGLPGQVPPAKFVFTPRPPGPYRPTITPAPAPTPAPAATPTEAPAKRRVRRKRTLWARIRARVRRLFR